MKINMIGSFIRNYPFGSEIAYMKALRDLNVAVCAFDPSRQSEKDLVFMNDADATIIFKDHGELSHRILQAAKSVGQKTIIYQPDDIRAPGIKDMMQRMRKYCDYAFTFDKAGAEVCKNELGYKSARKLLLCADPSVYYDMNLEKDIDISFVCSMSNPKMHKSRMSILHLLSDLKQDYKIHVETVMDSEKVNEIYNRSKITINHATDVGQPFGWGYGFQCRHFESALAGTCLLSNCLLDDEGDGPMSYTKFKSESSFIESIHHLLITGEWKYHSNIFTNQIKESFMPIHRAQDIIDFINKVKDEA